LRRFLTSARITAVCCESAWRILLIILSVQWVTVALQRPEPLKLHRGDTFRQQFRVDVNQSTWVEWMQLEGIGISMAHRIVADRTLNGPFHSIDDVARVPGIGDTTLDQIRPWLTMGHDLSTPQSLESTQNVADEQQALEPEAITNPRRRNSP
jgi:competence ComEA-like helix-hairpin-helix protein